MKILYWTPQFWPDIGGIQILAMRTLPPLMSRGYQFLVVTSHGASDQPDKMEYLGIPVQRFAFWSALTKNNIPLILKIQKQVAELISTFKPDLIHINFSGYTAFFQIATARDFPTPTLISLHSDLKGIRMEPDTTAGKLFQLANWVTAISKSTLESARQTIPGITGRSSVIYGCAEENNLEPAPLSFNPACVIGIGRLTHEKGFDILLDALSFIVDRYPKLSIKIIGDGPERASLEQQSSKLKLIDKVEWMGMIPNDKIPKYINAACLVVVPSRYQEPFGIVAVEAALLARPVVATNVSGLAEIVVNNETGYLVEMGNPRAFADAIMAILAQPEKSELMGLAGRLRVKREFSLEKYVDSYDGLYQQMVINQLPVTRERSEEDAA